MEGLEGTFFEPVGGSPLLIFVLTAGFVWQRSGRFAAALRTGGSPWLGAGLLVPAVGIAAWASYIDAPDLLIPSLQLLLLGGAALLGGKRGLASMWLPALFLLLAMPIPPLLLNSLLFPMQLFTANVSQWILELLGIPAVVVGDQVLTRSRIFQVIESCAGLRGILTLLMASIVYAELFGRRPGRAFLLFAAAPVVGMIANVARVQLIIFTPDSRLSAEHSAQGMLMTVAGVLALAGIDWVAQRLRPDPERPTGASIPLTCVPLPARLVVVGATLVAIALMPLVVPAWTPSARDAPPSIRSLPRELNGWTSNGIPLDTHFLGSVAFSDRIHRRYSRGDEAVDALIGEDDRLNRRGSIHSVKTAYPGSGWQLVESTPVEVDGVDSELFSFRSRAGERLVVHWREGFGDSGVEVARSLLGLDGSPFRREKPATIWRFSTAVTGSQEAARLRLLTLASALHGAWVEANATTGK